MSRDNNDILSDMKKSRNGEKNNWKDEWINMPYFNQVKINPFKEITVKFKTEEDYIAFGKLINQDFTPNSNSVVWYPKIIRGKVCRHANKLYVDEDES